MTAEAPAGPAVGRGVPGPRAAKSTHRVATLLVLAGLMLLLFPPSGLPMGPGIDAGYLFAANALAGSAFVPGRDFAFAYGPLAAYFLPQPIGDHLALGFLFHLGLWLVLGVALFRLANDAGPLRAALASVALLAAMSALFAVREYIFAVIGLVCVAGIAARERSAAPEAAALGALAVVGGLVKVSAGTLVAALAVGTIGVVAAWRGTRSAIRAGVLVLAGAAVATLALVPPLFGSAGNALAWLGWQMEVLGGFSGAMSQPGRPVAEVAGALATIAALSLAIALRTRSARGRTLAAAAPAILLAFKHSFVRVDAHAWSLVGLLFALAAMLALAPAGGTSARIVRFAPVAVAGLATAVGLAVGDAWLPLPADRALALASGRVAAAALRGALDPHAREQQLASASERLLAEARLPEAIANAWRASGGRFDAVPWDLTPIEANGLPYLPSPTIQLYQAYTPALDAWEAAHFASSAAPERLFVHFGPINDHQLLWEAPASWLAIAERYRNVADRPLAEWLLLERRARPMTARKRALGETAVEPDGWTSIPEAAPGEQIYLDLELGLSTFGRLRELVFRTEPIFLEVAYEGRWHRKAFRLIPALTHGLRIDAPPRSLDELAALFDGRPTERALRFRITGPGVGSFRMPVPVRFRAVALGLPLAPY